MDKSVELTDTQQVRHGMYVHKHNVCINMYACMHKCESMHTINHNNFDFKYMIDCKKVRSIFVIVIFTKPRAVMITYEHNNDHTCMLLKTV